jgi:hypothetical protein
VTVIHSVVETRAGGLISCAQERRGVCNIWESMREVVIVQEGKPAGEGASK